MKKTIDKQIGQRIRRLRDHLGLTREQLAARAGISTTFLYKIEVGRETFNMMILAALTKHLQTSSDYILYGSLKCQNMWELTHMMQKLPKRKQEKLLKIFCLICELAMD